MGGLVDEILESLRNGAPGPSTWFDRLPPEAQKELEEARQRFDPATHQKRAFALAVISAATRRGWAVAKEKQVIEWLLKKV